MTYKWSLSFLCLALILTTVAGISVAKTPVRLVTYGTATTTEQFNEMAKIFNASNPEYELSIEVYPYAEYPTKMTIMLASGVYPDVFLTWAQYKPAWAEQGFLLDVQSMWNSSSTARSSRLYPFALMRSDPRWSTWHSRPGIHLLQQVYRLPRLLRTARLDLARTGASRYSWDFRYSSS